MSSIAPPSRTSSRTNAWRAEASHDLGRDELGFPAAAAALQPILGLADYRYDATQAVIARYSRTGFSAAALTGGWFTMSREDDPPRRPGLLRVATLQFGHPYAVVAVTSDRRRLESTTHFGPRHRVPVYSAWVAEPSEADEDVFGGWPDRR